jgi:beta-glucosidase
MGGAAIADVLFGDANPSGKLPVTFPRNVGQIPLYYKPQIDRQTA